MPRKRRKLGSSGIYHVIMRGVNRQVIFENIADYLKYLDFLEFYKVECEFQIYAYCLMSNHVHLLIKVGKDPLSTIFRKLNTNYTQWFNAKYLRTGHLLQDRFLSEPVDSESYFRKVICYIHQNPAKGGLEVSPGKSYPWSSIWEYLYADPGYIDHDRTENSRTIVDIDFPVSMYSDLHKLLEEQVQLFHDPAVGNPSSENISSAPFNHGDRIMEKDVMDLDNIRIRLPDDVAREIICQESGCHNASEFQALPILQRNQIIPRIFQRHVSIRQLARLTGTSKKVIEKILAKAGQE